MLFYIWFKRSRLCIITKSETTNHFRTSPNSHFKFLFSCQFFYFHAEFSIFMPNLGRDMGDLPENNTFSACVEPENERCFWTSRLRRVQKLLSFSGSTPSENVLFSGKSPMSRPRFGMKIENSA